MEAIGAFLNSEYNSLSVVEAFVVGVVIFLIATAIVAACVRLFRVRLSVIRVGLHWAMLRFGRVFSWVVTEAKEWKRLFGFRRRELTWADLPQASKDIVRLRDLGKMAKAEIRLCDLPGSVKYELLGKYFFPRIQDKQVKAALFQLDRENYHPAGREANLLIKGIDDYSTVIEQNGMEIRVIIDFENGDYAFPFETNKRIRFRMANGCVMDGKPLEISEIRPGSQQVVAWISDLKFDNLFYYEEPKCYR